MQEPECVSTRRTFRWPGEAREMVRAYLFEAEAGAEGAPTDLKSLIGKLVQVSGNPQGRVLEVRAASRYCVKTGVPALDKKRAAEAARLDRHPHATGTDGSASSLAGISSVHAATFMGHR